MSFSFTFTPLTRPVCSIVPKPKNPGGIPNPPRSALDLYTPRFVQGSGPKKVGLCPICIEPRERGGEGKKVWLAMKTSAYNYHMQYNHGISASTGKPFSPPLAFRQVARPVVLKNERTTMKEGKCHSCRKWVPLDGVRDTEAKVKEMIWWKHSSACCGSSTVEGETDLFEDDEVFETVTALGLV
ncbi:hypothetical protein C8J56DRAFT_796094 [Mycena floridula]|nr:hypothetical protein C8J56DRAFT_796094 [Mycena floridula]